MATTETTDASATLTAFAEQAARVTTELGRQVRITEAGRTAVAESVTYNPETERYERSDGTEDSGCRARRLVECSSPAAVWGDR